ncbi:MAG: family 78 glycoside hydrolase catalytic domain [Cyclobacteriaceae bacterium]
MKFRFISFLLLALFAISFRLSAQVEVVQLKCEHLVQPIGIDNESPRLTWQMKDVRQGARQQAYQIKVSPDSLTLLKDEGLLWNSGKVTSDDQLIMYSGPRLNPFTRYYWSVQLWDKEDHASSPSTSSFETGFMGKANWKGSWISDNNSIAYKPAPYFRKVMVTSKKIKSARAYIAVGGLYELSINGKKIGDQVLNPMYTRFDRRTLYGTHDITNDLQTGKNAIGVLLGNGWYNHQSTAVWFFDQAPWRARPTFCMDLRITYEDGSVETITSGDDWKTSTGPLVFNSIYTAEHYDARLEQPGWNLVNFDDSKWKAATLRAAPSQHITAQVLHPIRHVEEIKPVSFRKVNDTTFIYDLGRNIAGVSRIATQGASGTILRLKHGERLKKDEHVDLSNIDVHYRPTDNTDPFQTDIFIVSGKGEESFMPRFNYKGFQYVEVTTSKPVELNAQSLTGYFMHSDIPPVGSINSSNEMINKLWKATNNAYLSNLFGYPTDCPQREKNGWTGDAHIAIETGLYSYDGITVYEKWLADHRDEQQPNGVLPAIIPTGGWGYQWANGPDWTSTIALIPWKIYLFYGDTKILKDNYQSIKLYVDHITDVYPSGLTTWGLGDWVPVKSKSPVELTSSIYYFMDVEIAANAAKVLGKPEDEKRYITLAQKIKAAINAKYLNKETGIYGTGLQTELSASLYGGIVPEESKALVAANLAKRVKADNYHLDTGVLGAKAILNALSDNGYADVAYQLASQETYPSWGWWIKNGATTLYENWDIESANDVSLNHIMFGEIGAWLYKGLGGIYPDPQKPGFRNTILRPYFAAGLNKFETSYHSAAGKIISNWRRDKTKVYYQVTIPANTTASLYVPKGYQLVSSPKLSTTTGDSVRLPAGVYEFVFSPKK